MSKRAIDGRDVITFEDWEKEEHKKRRMNWLRRKEKLVPLKRLISRLLLVLKHLRRQLILTTTPKRKRKYLKKLRKRDIVTLKIANYPQKRGL